jgi:hypothetical protein
MNLPRRRRSRPKGRARLALAGDFPDTGESVTEILERVRPADYDGSTVIFEGASDAGQPDTAVQPFEQAETGTLYENATPPPRAEPVARLRAEPAYRPPVPAGYAATTGPIPAIGRPAVSIGDALTRDDTWGPKLAPLPCGHCGTPPPVPAGILERTRIIGHVNWLAARDGWAFDYDMTWTCPDCQRGEAWKARQGQLELHRGDEPCDRHDAAPWADVDPDECRCTCPGAVVAVDVMLASEDHLGSGRGRYTAGAR